MDIIDSIISIINKIIFFILLLIVTICSINIKIMCKKLEKHLKDEEKLIKETINAIETSEKHYKKYKEYENFLKLNNFVDNFEDILDIKNRVKELELCNEFLEKNPDFNDKILRHKIYILIELGKYDEALKICDVLKNKGSEYYDTYYIQALIEYYAGLKDKEKAFELLDKNYNKNNKKDKSYYIEAGRIYFILEDYNKAIENFSAAIELDKSNEFGETVAPYYNRAKVYKKLNDIDKYNSDIKKIKELQEHRQKKLNDIDKYNSGIKELKEYHQKILKEINTKQK